MLWDENDLTLWHMSLSYINCVSMLIYDPAFSEWLPDTQTEGAIFSNLTLR